MNKVMSATDARIHFGELMRHVVENDVPIIVEKAGKPQVVILSVEEYERLQMSFEAVDKESVFADILMYAAQIRKRQSSEFPPSEEIIRQMREERDAQLLDNLS